MTSDTTTLAKLDELLAAIGACDDPRRASQWRQVYKLLQTTDLPGPQVTHVVGMRDVAALAELVDRLRAPADSGQVPAAAAGAVDEATCKRALRALAWLHCYLEEEAEDQTWDEMRQKAFRAVKVVARELELE